MADHKNLESIDEIFRKTFSDLQDTPASNGWDTPSDRVWNQVQAGIGKRNNGWTASKTILASAIVAVVVIGLYLAFNPAKPVNEATPPATTTQPAEIAAPAAPSVSAPAEKTVTAVPDVKKQPLKPEQIRRTDSPAATPNTVQNSTTPEKPEFPNQVEQQLNQQTVPINDKPAVKPPNSLERKRIKQQQKDSLEKGQE